MASSPAPQRIASRTAIDSGLDASRIAFVSQFTFVWLISAAILAVLMPTDGVFQVVVGLLLLAVSVTCLNGITGGVAHMVARELETGRPGTVSQAWAFVRRHMLGLMLGPFLLGLLTAVSLGAYVALVRLIAGGSDTGAVVGAVLIIPTFLLTASMVLFALNIYLIPTVMGVDQVGPLTAGRHLLRAVSRHPAKIVGNYLTTLLGLAGLVVVSGVVVLGGLTASVMICLGPNASFMLTGGGGVAGTVTNLSCVLVVFSWLAFLAIYVASSFAMLYYDSSDGASRPVA